MQKSRTSNESKLMDNVDEGTMFALKCLYFFYYASLSCIQPFLTVYYSSLGKGSEVIGVLSALRPFTILLVAPMWGVLADRSGSKSKILMFTVAMSTLLRSCLLLSATQHLWFLLLIVISFSIFIAPNKSLTDSIVMSYLPKEEKSIYCKIREWGPAGKIILSPVMAYVINNSSNGFPIAFSLSTVLSIPVILCISKLRSKHVSSSEVVKEKEKKEKKLTLIEAIGLVYQNKELMFFFAIIFIFGSAFGFVEAFVYVHIRQVFSNKELPSDWTMSICRMFMAVGGMLGYRVSAWLTKKSGTMFTIVTSLLSLSSSVFLYASAQEWKTLFPLQVTLFVAEILRSSSFSIMWSVSTVYVNAISSPKMSSSALALMDSVYTGLGQTIGCLFGGKLISIVGGIAVAFQFEGFLLLLTAFLLLSRVYQNDSSGQDKRNKQKEI